MTRQMRAAAVLWMMVRESLAPAVRCGGCATLEVVLLQLIAMIVDISPKVDQVKSAASRFQ